VNQKIHLKPLAISMAKNVHEPRLNPAAPHASDDVKDSNSPRCAFHLIPPVFQRVSDYRGAHCALAEGGETHGQCGAGQLLPGTSAPAAAVTG
jgi:hypothetical protein